MSASSWLGPRSVDGGLDEVDLGSVPGRLWLCGKHLVGPDPEAALARAGDAELLVCLNERRELADRYPGYVDWLDDSHTPSIWIEVPDLHIPTPDEADLLARSIADRLGAGSGVVVHCGAGMGRAPTVAMCAMITLGWSHTDALELVKAARPLAGPESGAQSDLVRTFRP